MAKDPRLESLRQKHAALEAEIAEQYARPQPDDAAIKRLKIEKLHLKEQIEAMTSVDGH